MLKRLWAKKRTIQDIEGPLCHPLIFHMIDVVAVTECFWRSILERHITDQISKILGLNLEQAGKWISFWAGLHDIGKASPAFQGKWNFGWERLDEELRKKRPPHNPLPHGILSAEFIPELLKENFSFFPHSLAHKLGRTLGGHHGSFPRSGELIDIHYDKDQKGGRKWQKVRNGLFEKYSGLFQVKNAGIPRDDPGNGFFLVLAGLVSVADWIGSNEDYFPFTPANLDLETYAAKSRQRAEKALNSLGWLGWRAPERFVQMEDLFPAIREFGRRPLQQAVVDLGETLSEPGLVILEAPMGEGKTEAAMYLADRWAVTLGQRGCYFALPTMATSNQMFGRVKEFLQDRYPSELINFQLLHGHASLSAEFELLRQAAYRFFAPTAVEVEDKPEIGKPSAEILAAEWFTQKKRGLLAPFGVGTVDQALLAVLKTKHYFVRLFGLTGKTVIIDEVHAYDAYMTTLLERLLEWLAACHCSVVLLSATLPEKRRQTLLEAFARGLGKQTPTLEGKHSPYPRLSWMSHSSSGEEHFPASRQFSRLIHYKWIDGSIPYGKGKVFDLGVRLQEALAHGGCAAVICNTVGRAQEVYRALKPYFPDLADDGRPELTLFHARCLYQDREKWEGRALRRFGKPSNPEVRRPQRAVLVATQVIEQSLDLDFDLMVTEMAPVDLLLQRAGRLHRHLRPRPPGLENPQQWIVAPEWHAGVPNFGPGTEWVYERHILLRSWLALRDRQTISIPEDVEALIEAVYSEARTPEGLSSDLVEEWERSLEELENDLERDAAEAKTRYILPPYHRDDILEDRNPELEEDDPEVHKSLQAVTRLGAPNLSIICLYKRGEGVSLDFEGRNLVNLQEKPSGGSILPLLHRSVTLTHRGLVPWLLTYAERPPGWQKHVLFCRCRLVLLDEHHVWQGGNYTIRIDPEEGVVITKQEKED